MVSLGMWYLISIFRTVFIKFYMFTLKLPIFSAVYKSAWVETGIWETC